MAEMNEPIVYSQEIMDALDSVFLAMLDDPSDQAMPQLHWLWTCLKHKADEERKYDD